MGTGEGAEGRLWDGRLSFLSIVCHYHRAGRGLLRGSPFPEPDRHLLELSQPEEKAVTPGQPDSRGLRQWGGVSGQGQQQDGRQGPRPTSSRWKLRALAERATGAGRPRLQDAPAVDSLHVSGTSHFCVSLSPQKDKLIPHLPLQGSEEISQGKGNGRPATNRESL